MFCHGLGTGSGVSGVAIRLRQLGLVVVSGALAGTWAMSGQEGGLFGGEGSLEAKETGFSSFIREWGARGWA